MCLVFACLLVWGCGEQGCSLSPWSTIVFSSSIVHCSHWRAVLSDPVLLCNIHVLACIWWVLCRIHFFTLPSVVGDLWWHWYSIMGSRPFYALFCRGRCFFSFTLTTTAVGLKLYLGGVAWFAAPPTQLKCLFSREEESSQTCVPFLLHLFSRTLPPKGLPAPPTILLLSIWLRSVEKNL